MIEVLDDIKEPSTFFHDMNGTTMPIAVSQYVFFLFTPRENYEPFSFLLESMLIFYIPYSGEGRAYFLNASSQTTAAQALLSSNLVSIRYVDNYLRPTESYPANPNGSPCGIAGIDPSKPCT